jgi:hypothetical protein
MKINKWPMAAWAALHTAMQAIAQIMGASYQPILNLLKVSALLAVDLI